MKEQEEKSDAQKTMEGKELLLRRPPDMTKEEFKILSRIQNKVLKMLFPKPPLRRVSALMTSRLGYNFHPFKTNQ